MTTPRLHLIKLCVGADGPADLVAWQAQARAQGPDGLPRHVTRMWPKRAEELLQGGSIYWIFRGEIGARQRILRLDEVDRGDGIKRCGIVLDPEVMLTRPAPRRPFQGWRYLKADQAPDDLRVAAKDEPELPEELRRNLDLLGVL